MSKTLGLIHTLATMVPIFQPLNAKCLTEKEIKVFSVGDDSLIKKTIERGELTPDTARSVMDYVGSAEAFDADSILGTFSSTESFEALMDGQIKLHDKKEASALNELMLIVDVILTEASRVNSVDQLPAEDKKAPIPNSHEMAIQHIANIL